MAESEHPAVELRGFRPVDLGDGRIQLRFDALAVPAGAAEVVPTLTLSHEALSDLGAKLKLLAAELPMPTGNDRPPHLARPAAGSGREGKPIRDMIRWLATSVACACVLSGCAVLQHETPPDALAIATRACLAQNKQFVDTWGCVQNKDLLDQIGGDAQRRRQFMKLGDDLASQVAAKKLSSAAAAKRLEAGLSAGAPS